MGTDYLQLLDRSSSELILLAGHEELAAFVDLHGHGVAGAPLVWREYWNSEQEQFVEFASGVTPRHRLETLLQHGTQLDEVKAGLIHELCMSAYLHLDYWGCGVEVFGSHRPPGAVAGDTFTTGIPADDREGIEESSGGFLLTAENVSAIIRSLDAHRKDLSVMDGAQLDRLRTWQALCEKQPQRYCIVYQIDS